MDAADAFPPSPGSGPSRSRRERLEGLRDLLEGLLKDAAPREAAPLAKQYRDTLAELANLPADERVEDILDEFVDQVEQWSAGRGGA